MKSLITGTLLIVFLFSAAVQVNGQAKKAKPGFDLNNLDKSVRPQVDFYEYAIGNWLKNNPIPDQYSSWGAFEMLYEENITILKKILEDAANNTTAPKGSPIQKVGTFYRLGMDEAKINADGFNPIKGYLNKIESAKTYDDIVKLTSYLQEHVGSLFFSYYVYIDSKNSAINIMNLSQGGLNLPDRDYYLTDDARSKEIREKYVKHIENNFKLINVSEAEAKEYALAIMSFETKLAKNSRSLLELDDPEKNYNKMSLNEIIKIAPDFNWKLFFKSIGVSDPGKTNVGQPEFFKAFNTIFKETSIEDLKAYLKWNLLVNAAPYLSAPFVNERFEFFAKFLNGQKVITDRWKRVNNAADGLLGQIIGQIYVKENFPPEAKQRAVKIVKNLLAAMGERIKGLDWMSDATKKQALIKLNAFKTKIGYPDKWKDYSKLEIKNDSYYDNIVRGNYFESKRNLSELGKKVDKTKWDINPQMVNAFYNSNKNEIIFPAGILQPPFFNKDADDAINYGAMGAVIGHEVSHGFDNSGRQFDEKGNIRDWWTKEDNDKFKERANALAKQYDNFVVVDTFRVNGQLTLGEDIGDLGGLTVSLTAFKNTEQYKKNEKIDGFTPTQRFFLSWAQVWETNQRDESIKLLIKTNVHPPSKPRVILPLKNMPAFFEAFDVKPGDPMRNADKDVVKIW
jgi:putative endopeptidase